MTPQHIQPTRIAIIGAGLTGLITATLLERAFADTTIKPKVDIFEKSAGVGRLATRYQTPNNDIKTNVLDNTCKSQYQFDFGAAFFTAKSNLFHDFIQPWVQQGVLRPWFANVAYFDNQAGSDRLKFIANASIQEQWGTHKPRYISTPKMSSWGRELANSLSITHLHFKTLVTPLTDASYNDNTKLTSLYDDKGNRLGEFDWVICTAPNVQAFELFADTTFSHLADIDKFKMQACYSLMLGWQTPKRLPQVLQDAKWDVALAKTATGQRILDKLFIEHHKPARDDILPSLTVHANNEWSQVHVNDDIKVVTNTLIEAVSHLLDWQDSAYPDHIDCHRWRYASTDSESINNLSHTGEQHAFIDTSHHWIVAGDWCANGRIEGCYASALQVVSHIKPS